MIFHGSEFVELLENFLWLVTILNLNYDLGALLAIGEIDDVRDSKDLFGFNKIGDLLDNLLGADVVWEFRDDDALFARGDLLDNCSCPDLK